MNVLALVPKVGIEPTLPKEHEFESCASTSSATLAFEVDLKYTTFRITSSK